MSSRQSTFNKIQDNDDSKGKTKSMEDQKVNVKKDNEEQEKPKVDFRKDRFLNRQEVRKTDLSDIKKDGSKDVDVKNGTKSEVKSSADKMARQISITIDESPSSNDRNDVTKEKQSRSSVEINASPPTLGVSNTESKPATVKGSNSDSLLGPKSANDSFTKGDDQSSGKRRRRSRGQRRPTGVVPSNLTFSEVGLRIRLDI